MTHPYTKRVLWAFGAECAVLSGSLLLLDRLPAWVLKASAVVAIAIPIICYTAILSKPSVHWAWWYVIRELRRSLVAGFRSVRDCFSIKSACYLARCLKQMKVYPSTADEWFVVVLFPFKVFLLMAVPFLWVCQALQSIFGSDPVRISRSAAIFPVSRGFEISLLALLVGSLVQALFSERGRSTQTLLVMLLGILLFGPLWLRGMAGR